MGCRNCSVDKFDSFFGVLILGKTIKTIATSVGFLFLLQCLGCGPGTTQAASDQSVTPDISQVQPQTIAAGSQSMTIKVTGTNFSSDSAVLWNGAALPTTVVDSNTLSSTVGSSSLTTPTTVQLQVQDKQSKKSSKTVPVTITGADAGPSSALSISIASLPQGVVGSSYSGSFTAVGGASPYTWSVSSGQLPPGLVLSSSTGVLSGTPAASGNYNFGIKLIDSSSSVQSATTTVSLPVVTTAPVTPPLAITTTSIPTGTIGSAYSTVLQSTGGTAPYAWSITAGGLPNGLSFSATTGLISGTPTAAGTTNFTAAIADSSNPAQTKSVQLALVITATPLGITTSSLPSGTIGSTYTNLLQATGGTAPYTWSIASGSLPAGLSLASATGIISGTPTTAGTFSFTATAADAGSPAQSKSVSLSIVIAPVTLAISTSALPSGTQNSSYSGTLQAFGGTGTYTWSIASGTLPAGLSLAPSTGVVSGTPTSSGNTSFKVAVSDTGSPVQSATATISLSIVAAGTPLAISSTSLPTGKPNKPYNATLNATGGTSPYTWSITNGSLPSGLSFATATGVISGKATASSSTSLTFQVIDSSSTPQTKSITLTLAIAPTAIAITSSTLSAGTKGSSYSSLLQASGGTTPYTWSISAGSLPAGLSLAPSTGLISGTPTATGTSNFTVTVADAGNPVQTASATTSIVVAAPAPPALAITTSSMPAGTNGTSYSSALQASGGTSPYAWSITAGSLPAGLSLNQGTGLISGTPTTNGTSNFTATVTDGGSPAQTKSVPLSIVVAAAAPPALAITTSSMPAGTNGTSYSNALQASGGTSPYAWSITAGSLPAGLSLNQATGLISGTPTTNGTSNFTATVTDSGSPAQTKSATLSIVVSAAGPSALTISVTLPSGTAGTAYSSSMSASGGTPAYTWSITAGSLPTGLTLAASSGTISGTPSATGTYNFTATVTDNSSPTAQTKSAATSIVVSAPGPTGPGTTWYIRPDGGTRYSANAPTGQCDGQADVAYSGSGTNQHCAFSDYRFLYDDQSYQNSAWVIAGGDTVIIRGGPYRIGVSQGTNPADIWCNGFGNPYGCFNPTIPAGSPTQHTRILGENYGSCSQSNMTQLYGGFGLWSVINLDGAQYVDVQCVELTRHSQCVRFGVPALPSYCNSSFPIDDYAANGMITDQNTHDILIQDVWIHGFTSRGIIGPIGGTVTATRVDIAYNGAAGWDFDDGNTTPSLNAVLNLSSVIIEWNGCNQAYPGTGAVSCYDDTSGGYGDGIGTPAGTCLTAHVDHSTFRYNTQDGYDMLHNDTGNCSMSITDSTSYGNMGSQFKWGPNDNPMVFTNNTVLANCMRLSAPFPGQPSTYNANLHDLCRASDSIAFGFRDGGTLLMANNTIVATAPTTFDSSCSGTYPQTPGQGTCANSTFTFENNIVYGIDDPSTYNAGGVPGGPGAFYYDTPIGHVIRTNNIYFGMGHGFNCSTGFPAEQCQDPLFVGEPVFTQESDLDNFNFKISSGSPAVGAGIPIPSLTLDYSGASRPNPPSLGALEP